MLQQRKRAAKIKNELKSARVIDLVRFPIMSQAFFHEVVEACGVVPARLLLERS
jgi:hypothetical protein